MKTHSYEVPKEGSLGLLALGHRGLDAWREVRGTDWIAEREAERPEPKRSPLAQKRPDTSVLNDLVVTIVSGLPRSGTSMAMQMLVAGGLDAFVDDARAPDSSNPRGYFEHESIKSTHRDARWVADADGQVAKVVAPILPVLPPGPTYRVVFMDRAVDEVLRSQQRMLEAAGQDVVTDDRLADAYAAFVEAAMDWADDTPGATLLRVSHRDAVQNPSDAAARIADFLDHADQTLDRTAMAAAVDPSLHRNRS